MSQRLNLEEFTAMVRELSPAEIAKLPLDIMPETIPTQLIRNAPAPMRAVLEKMAFAASQAELRAAQRMDQVLGATVLQAMDKARGYEADIAISRLQHRMEDLKPTLDRWRNEKISHHSMAQSMLTLREEVRELQAERARQARAEVVLIQTLQNPGGFADRLRQALDGIRAVSNKVDQSLGEYLVLQLEVSAADMAEKRTQISEADKVRAALFEELAHLEAQIKSPSNWMARLLPWASRKKEEFLRQQISDLYQRVMNEEWVMAESQLIRWLDVIVDASLYGSSDAGQNHLRSARLNLFFLLNAFCEQQEAAAKKIARNPFVQTDPKQAIEYMLISERFILDYFAKKRAEVIEWLGNAADTRLKTLEGLEANLVIEMKRNLRNR
ncbi:MAG: hypothetical protein B7Y40_04950 [Gammaproteobacteria bacterium 28-57-27]|nr:MAG: hypothetical protein B7Y40_04950 [Gammaproteobacteria bacterium 28-57-27]